MNLFAARLKFPKTDISEAFIESQMRQVGFSDEQILAWRQFYARSLGVTFAVLPETDNMYEEAEQWITLLELLL